MGIIQSILLCQISVAAKPPLSGQPAISAGCGNVESKSIYVIEGFFAEVVL